MKKFVFVSAVFLFTSLISCTDDKKRVPIELTPQARADSLEKDVEEGHNITMPKSMRIPDLRKEIKRLVDSVGKLPAKAQEAAAPFKEKLNSVDKELSDAYDSMEKWMESFGNQLDEINKESMKDSLALRIKFFAEEKIKITDVKDAVLGSVKKAESLLKEKF